MTKLAFDDQSFHTYVGEFVSNHVPDPPRRVACASTKSRHYQLFDIFLLQQCGDTNASFDRQ